MVLRARSKFGVLMFEPEFFRKQMYCVVESTCDIVGTFRCPPLSFGARGIVSSSPPLYAPGYHCLCITLFGSNDFLLL